MDLEQTRYEPLPRWGHVSVVIGNKLYLWGGRIEDFSEESKKEVSFCRVCLTSCGCLGGHFGGVRFLG